MDPLFEGSLEVKLPTIGTNEKQRWEERERREEKNEDKKRKPEKKEDSGARKGIGVSPMICVSGG
jgi:hypothetical protein